MVKKMPTKEQLKKENDALKNTILSNRVESAIDTNRKEIKNSVLDMLFMYSSMRQAHKSYSAPLLVLINLFYMIYIYVIVVIGMNTIRPILNIIMPVLLGALTP